MVMKSVCIWDEKYMRMVMKSLRKYMNLVTRKIAQGTSDLMDQKSELLLCSPLIFLIINVEVGQWTGDNLIKNDQKYCIPMHLKEIPGI